MRSWRPARGWLPRIVGLLPAILCAACAGTGAGDPAHLPIDDLSRPSGFEVGLFAIVPGAHSLASDSHGTIYVGTLRGEVVRLSDDDRDGIADRAERRLDGLDPPVDLAVGPDDALFVAERDEVLRLDPNDGPEPVLPEGVLPSAPPERHRPIAVGDDGRLYLAVPPACRGCPTRGLAASIVRVRPDGHQLEVVVREVDVSGLGWRVRTQALVFAARADRVVAAAPGISGLFDLPHVPRTLLAAAPASLNGEEVWFDQIEPALGWTFEPGSTPQAIGFYRGTGFPGRFRDALLVVLGPAPHGSPLVAPPISPKIVAIRFDRDGTPVAEEVLLEGWGGRGDEPWGRPSDLEELADGSVLIADERAGVVYRLSYAP